MACALCDCDDVLMVVCQRSPPFLLLARIVLAQEFVPNNEQASSSKVLFHIGEIGALVVRRNMMVREGGHYKIEAAWGIESAAVFAVPFHFTLLATHCFR